jgi:hypothetical protein
MSSVLTLNRAVATHGAPLAAVTGIFVLSALFFDSIDYTDTQHANMDLHDYRAIAQAAPGLAQEVMAPFAFRIAGPWLAGTLPGPDPIAFGLLTLAVAFVLLLALYAWVVSLGISSEAAVLACAVLAFSKSTYGFLLFNYFQLNDLMTLTLLCLALIAMRHNKWLIFWGLLLVSLLFRETLLILIPVCAVYLLRKKQPRLPWEFVLGAGAAIGLYFFLRLLIPHVSGSTLIDEFRIEKLSLPNLYSSLFNTFVPVTLVPLVFYRSTITRAVRNPEMVVLIVCCFVTTLVAFDSERLMMPALIVVLTCIAAQYDELGQPRFLGIVTTAAAVLCGLSATLTVISIPRPLSIVLSLSLTVAVGLAWWYTIRKRSQLLDSTSV